MEQFVLSFLFGALFGGVITFIMMKAASLSKPPVEGGSGPGFSRPSESGESVEGERR